MEKQIEELQKILEDIDGIYHFHMNNLIYQYKCNCDSNWWVCKNRLSYILQSKYVWLKNELHKELKRLLYLQRTPKFFKYVPMGINPNKLRMN